MTIFIEPRVAKLELKTLLYPQGKPKITTQGGAMSNEEHLAILKKGTDTWNRWREENPDVERDLEGAELKWKTLSGANL